MTQETQEDAEPDWLSPIRDRQAEIAEAIAEDKLLPLYAACEGVVPESFDSNNDPVAREVAMRSELHRAVRLAFEGYTDWVACRIVRAGTYEQWQMHIPGDDVLLAIAAKYDTQVPIVRFVIACANEEPSLPILGDIDCGVLTPDETALKKWAAHYDWSE